MKIIIDMPKGLYESICDGFLSECLIATTEAIKNATVVEEINNPCTECGANDCSRENCPNRKIYVKMQ